VFDTDGQLLRRFAANGSGAGPLQNPWGIVQAPRNFGAYSNDLLIGNVAGAGNINVYNPTTGAYLGQMDQPDGAPIAITGLWALEFGAGTWYGGQSNQLFFDAGPNAPGVSGFGLFGVIQPSGRQGGNGGYGWFGWLFNELFIGAFGNGRGPLFGGVQAQPATAPSPAPAAGSNQADALFSTPTGLPLGAAADSIRDQLFADLEGVQSAALALTADPTWNW
jgi:hypothetical protein